MAIKKYYVARRKDGFPYDSKKGKYFSWGFDIWIDGTRISERGFFTRDQAEAAVTSQREDAKNIKHGLPGKIDSPRLIELFQKKLDSITIVRDRTRSKRVFLFFLNLLPPQIKVLDLKRAHLQTYVDARMKDGVKNSTIRREMVPIIEVLNNADQYFVELDSFRPPRKPKLTISKTRNTVTIQADDRRKLLNWLLAPQRETERVYQAAARRRVGLFLQFCLLTVSRPGETASVRKADVDLAASVVRIKGTKTDTKQHSIREVPVTPTMRSILIERFELNSGDYLFTKGGYVTHRMRSQMKEACEAVGIKYGRNVVDGITFHTARHTATTVLAHSNRVDTKTAGKFTGHADETMTLYYTHANAETLAIASQVLEESMGNISLDGEYLETKPKTE